MEDSEGAPTSDVDRESTATEARLDSTDPLRTGVETVGQEVRDVGQAVEALHRAQEDLDAAVVRARAAGASWNVLALPLGVGRQAARQKYARREASTRL